MVDLKSILQKHPNCLNSRASFKSILMDTYPSEKRVVNILTILFECGVASKIQAKTSIDPNEMQGLITQIENEYGITGQYSQEAILTWADAFGVNATSIQLSPQVVPPPNNVVPQATDWEYVDLGNNTVELIAYKGKLPTQIVFPDCVDNKTVVSIGSTALGDTKPKGSDRINVESVVVPKGVRRIESNAFMGCKALKDVSLPEGLESIGENAFKNCKALSRISLPQGIRFIGNYAFVGSGIRSVVLPGSIGSVSKGAFSNCKQLSNVTLLEGISTIQSEAFSGCKAIASIAFPDGVTVIEASAFYDCKGLNRVSIPDSVKHIEYRAFAYCTDLTNVTLPRGLKILEQEVFYCCGFGSFVVPDGVVQIKEDAFANCWSLTRITIPESVTKIDADTFFNILSDIHIECYRDSYAHKWATSHKAKFELIEKPQ